MNRTDKVMVNDYERTLMIRNFDRKTITILFDLESYEEERSNLIANRGIPSTPTDCIDMGGE